MPAIRLDAVGTGSDVFIDANVLVYGISGRSAECLAFLQRCASEDIVGVTSLPIINEACHRFMLLEARARGHVQQERATELRRRPEVIRGLTDYWVWTRKIFELNLLIVGLDESILRRAQLNREAYGLLTNDSVLVATMEWYALDHLATRDEDFDRVTPLTVCRPADI